MQPSSPPTNRSLGRLGLALYAIFLIAALAFGLWLRDHSAGKGRLAAKEAAGKPNIVLIVADDLRLGHLRAMPRVSRRLGKRGIEFDRYYVSDPLDSPARATLLTGRYPHNHGVTADSGSASLSALEEDDTLATWLEDAGYRTAFVGKYMTGYGPDQAERVPKGWSEWHALVDPASDFADYAVSENGEIQRYGGDPREFQTRVLGRFASAAVRHAAHANRPLFLQLSFSAPSPPAAPAPEDEGTLADLELRRTRAFNEDDVSDKPSFIRRRPPLNEAAVARIDARQQRAAESLVEVDRQIERLLETLASHGELDDTYFIFTSDHGYLDGEHRIELGRGLPHDAASRVPLIIRGPDVRADSSSVAVVADVDIAATIADIADADPTTALDGRSLLPFASDPKRDDRGPVLIESPGKDGASGEAYLGVRTDRYLYVRYANGEEELYDRQADPLELDSVAGDPRYRETKRALARAVEDLAECEGDGCTVAEIVAPEPR